ncbi:MAG: nucleotide-binding protein [Candidatus Lambdaproteobacteria bacterium]|nr:nucleotide-binding protein [Candidatus Lambdaproteobacteria bacterium]
MNIDEIKRALSEQSIAVTEESRLPNDIGSQLRLQNEAIVNAFDKGTWNVQGKNPGKKDIEKILSDAAAGNKGTRPVTNRNVFIVYGHDTATRDATENMLRRWKLNPIILDQIPSEGKTIIEKLEKYRSQAQYAVVLATPDDIGHRAEKKDEIAFRARQNVVLELGMMLAILGRQRVAILIKGQEKMERPSDIQGLIYIPFKDDVKETRLQLAKEINSQGITIDLKAV